jgi:putative membrane protein
MNTQSLVRASLAAVCGLLASMAVFGQDQYKDASKNAQSRQFVDDKTFVTGAAICAVKQVRLATLASENATSESIKRLAKQIASDHSTMRHDLIKIAEAEGYQLPSASIFETVAKETQTLSKDSDLPKNEAISELNTDNDYGVAQHQKDFKRLQGLEGLQFDEAFIECMQKDHKMAIEVFEQASISAKSSAVRTFAVSKLPVLKLDLAAAVQIGREIRERNLTNR